MTLTPSKVTSPMATCDNTFDFFGLRVQPSKPSNCEGIALIAFIWRRSCCLSASFTGVSQLDSASLKQEHFCVPQGMESAFIFGGGGLHFSLPNVIQCVGHGG